MRYDLRLVTLISLAFLLVVGGSLRAEPLKVLSIGNSFSIRMHEHVPLVLEGLGMKIDMASLYIGGCSLERHWRNAVNTNDLSYLLQWSRDGKKQGRWPELAKCRKPTFWKDKKTGVLSPAKGANICEVLKAEPWDVVTIQQASACSWRADTYHPYGDDIIRIIRKCAPTAKIVVQETWSGTPFDRRLADWGIDQDAMYEKLHTAYRDFAAGYGFEVIPTGTAVQEWRRRLPVRYTENSLGGDVVGRTTFTFKEGKWIPQGDAFHMNQRGHYFQALVWGAKLMGADMTKCRYKPSCVTDDEADLMRRIANEVVRRETGAFGDPYDYKDLVTTASSPVEVRPGLFDFGRDGFGWLELRGVTGCVYELIMGEMTNSAGHVDNPYPKSCIRCQTVGGCVTSDVFRVTMKPDRLNLIGLAPKTAPAVRLPERFGTVFPFRFVEVIRGRDRLRAGNLVRQMVHYPMDMSQASFECDNAVLNKVYDFCRYSVLATSFCGIYVDGDRERTAYEADAYINQLSHYSIDSDYSLARKTHEWLMEHPTWPTEWKQHSIKIAWTDWMWTGDARSLSKYYGELRAKLRQARGRRDIVDWPRSERDGFTMTNSNSVVEAFHCRNLVELSEIASAIGQTNDAIRYHEEAEQLKKSFVADFFDAEAGLFVDSVEAKRISFHANAIALAFDLAPSGSVNRIVGYLEKRGMACSTYFAQYLLEGLCRAGRVDLAVRQMSSSGARSWKGMIDFGATITMESWNMSVKPNQDLNHAWSASPLNIITRYVLGVTPLKPGFKEISVSPNLGGLEYMRGRVPTPRGLVEVMVDNGHLHVVTPAQAKIVWKGNSYQVGSGSHVF